MPAERLEMTLDPTGGAILTWPHVGDIVEYPAFSGRLWTVVEWRSRSYVIERRPPIPRRVMPKSNRKSKNKSRGAGA